MDREIEFRHRRRVLYEGPFFVCDGRIVTANDLPVSEAVLALAVELLNHARDQAEHSPERY